MPIREKNRLPETNVIKPQSVLFPHTTLKKDDLERILFFFSPLAVFQPWYMGLPVSFKRYIDGSLLTAIYPPSDFRPEKDINKILSGYESWISQLAKKDYANSLKAAQALSISDEHSWDIRKTLYGSETGNIEGSDNPWLKWHILLHLARKLEESSSDAYDLLKQAKAKKPPLEEALEVKAISPGLLDDVPESHAYEQLDKYQISGVIQAWLGLFGTYLFDYRSLITVDDNVMDTVKSAFEETSLGKSAPSLMPSVRIIIPDSAIFDSNDSEDLGIKTLKGIVSSTFEKIFITFEKHEKPG